MQIDYREIGRNWVDFNTITTPAADTTYQIYNRGPFNVLAVEASATPTTQAGVLVRPYETLIYKKGTQTLYLKAEGATNINTSAEG